MGGVGGKGGDAPSKSISFTKNPNLKIKKKHPNVIFFSGGGGSGKGYSKSIFY